MLTLTIKPLAPTLTLTPTLILAVILYPASMQVSGPSMQKLNIAMHRRAGQAAIDAREVTYGIVDTKLRMMQILIPDPLDQLWEILRQAPSHYQRIHLACSPSGHNDPGALRQHSAII